MANTAKNVNLPPEGYHGGIIHDETKFQEALVLNVKGRENNRVGFVETGEESDALRIMKKRNMEPTVASDVLQITIAHYPTNTVTAPELYGILWDIIGELQSWGFITNVILQDGGDQNRQFMRLHFNNDEDAIRKNYMSPNLAYLARNVAYSQDVSHNVKKLRNAVLSGGTQKHHTRHLRLRGQSIVGLDAVRWDEKTNSRRANRTISTSHMYPGSAEIVRNHLAEEMLDQDFMYLMQAYQKFLQNRSVFDGTERFLEQTSQLISIFTDKRPISSVTDIRLSTLKKIQKWFRDWKEEVHCLVGLSAKVTPVHKLSHQNCQQAVTPYPWRMETSYRCLMINSVGHTPDRQRVELF
ncbi:hypothetical protein KP79_PYT25311 [Mizuhopecten yessoensis]|uniref:Uncharacterized protein n=1 Tax=Mizuhopecten yessoensis TaxID=6573 RepID=A0A210PKZ0_MIZYE|nr:hypothetical protein KP79_PYT25311 [Mizuhopecten yessoensis]